jgi:hypothetical protein
LDAAGKTAFEIINKDCRGSRIAISHHERWDEFCVSVDCRPRPHVPNAEISLHIGGDVLFLRIDERPRFVTLNPLALQVAESTILIINAGVAKFHQ